MNSIPDSKVHRAIIGANLGPPGLAKYPLYILPTCVKVYKLEILLFQVKIPNR